MPHKDPAARRAYVKVWRDRNRDKVAAYARQDYTRNREKVLARQKVRRPEIRAQRREMTPEARKAEALWGCYKLTLAQFEAMLAAQDNKCLLCERPFVKMPNVDHDHGDGHVRGLLCCGCNTALGRLEKHGVEWWSRLLTYTLTR